MGTNTAPRWTMNQRLNPISVHNFVRRGTREKVVLKCWKGEIIRNHGLSRTLEHTVTGWEGHKAWKGMQEPLTVFVCKKLSSPLGWVRLLRAFGNCQYGLGGEVVDCTCSVVGGGYTVTPIIWKHDIEDGQFSGSIASYHLWFEGERFNKSPPKVCKTCDSKAKWHSSDLSSIQVPTWW